MFKLNCTLKDAGQTVAVSEKFSKRLFTATYADGKYDQTVEFQLVQDNVGLIDAYRPGSQIEVSFGVKGREWTNPNTGEIRVFNTLEAFRIEGVKSAPSPFPAPAAILADAEGDPDLPF